MIAGQLVHGLTIKVNTPTHVAGTLEFASGAIGTIIMSYDVWAHRLPHIEIYGTDGTTTNRVPSSWLT
jgi:predicted dehydrogenase